MKADVAILGAGLAGAAAACTCAAAGLSTVILEARDRAGGRGFTRKFAGSEDLLEFGGSWVASTPSSSLWVAGG